MPADAIVLRSPDTQLELKFALVDGVPTYALDRAGAAVILPSRMGFELIGRESLDKGFTLKASSFNSFDETWEPVWGEEAEIRNHYNELLVNLGKESGEAMNIRFRLYDDGLGFRYEFPLENKLTYFNIREELTEFALTEDPTAWWVPGDYDIQEFCPTESRLAEVRTATDSVRATGGWPRVQSSPTG
ncbi:MAG: glycoside hydrolase family 97 N-terminal domain-containing protein, partial [Bacteroidales bacterium]|nr:glycoside hydrolase family 97 N-terminal domain-containing protein [Bacteroidales bacterium]